MNEFIDPRNGKMIAQTTSNSCKGCFYDDGKCACPEVYEENPMRTSVYSQDNRDIIWIEAENTKL